MKNFFYSALLLSLLFFFSFSFAKGNPTAELAICKEQLHEIEHFETVTLEIMEKHEFWSGIVFKEQHTICKDSYQKLSEIYSSIEGIATENENQEEIHLLLDKFQDVYNQARLAYEKVIFADHAVETKARKDLEVEKNYFKLWEQVLYKRKRIDGLYLKTIKIGTSSYGGSGDRETQQPRKRAIYYKTNVYYDHALIQLKLRRSYLDKIEIEEKIIKILDKIEVLLNRETKVLEKELRKIDDPETIFTKIMEY